MIGFLLGVGLGGLAALVACWFVMRAVFARHWLRMLGDASYTLTVRREIRKVFWL